MTMSDLPRRPPACGWRRPGPCPAYDPDEPTGVSRMPTVTVVVVPDGAGARALARRPLPGGGTAQLDAVRPIGTRVKVVPPVYVELEITVSLRGGEDGVEAAIRSALEAWLAGSGIGGILRAGDAAACVPGRPRRPPGAEGGSADCQPRLLPDRGGGYPGSPGGPFQSSGRCTWSAFRWSGSDTDMVRRRSVRRHGANTGPDGILLRRTVDGRPVPPH